jgi:predicted transcriptional regulator
MTKLVPVSVSLEPDLDDQVAEIATHLDRSKAWVIEQAVKEFVAVRDWQAAAIDEGIRAADEGRVAEHDDVAAWVASWGQPDEKPTPKCD